MHLLLPLAAAVARTLGAQGVPAPAPASMRASPAMREGERPPDHAGPRIGLALSGGGARGLAHVGVLRALERAGVRVDAIAGTSMGSLVGGLYAAGYSAAQLETLAQEIEWGVLFTDAPARGALEPFDRGQANPILLSLPMRGGHIQLPSGAIAGQHVADLFARLTWPVQTEHDFSRLPIPFRAVATDIATGEAVVLDSGSLAGAMRASMSLPSIFAPATVEGRVLLDGGLVRSLPAQDVRAMGADLVICSDVSEPLLDASRLRTMLDVLNQAVAYHGNESILHERTLCDVYIRPDVEGLDGFSFAEAAQWIARGDSAAESVSAQLHDLVVRAGGPAPPVRGIDASRRARPVRLVGARVDASTDAARALVLTMLGVAVPGVADPQRLADATAQVYGSGLFETVTWALSPVAGAADSVAVLTVSAQGENADRVGMGFRYDDRYNASLLFDATVRHLLGFASTGRLSLRLGEQTRVALDVARGRTLNAHWVLGTGVSYLSTPVDFYQDGRRSAEAMFRAASANVTVGGALRGGGLALQLTGEDARSSAAVAFVDSTRHRTFGSAAALVWWDDLDEPAFTRRGAKVRLRYERAAGGGAPFTRWLGVSGIAVPLARRVALGGHASAGASSPDSTIPLHYRFFLGGLTPSAVLADAQRPFTGRRAQEEMDFAVAVAGASLQWEVARNVFVTLRGDVGGVGRSVDAAIAARTVGTGLSLGTRTLVGPVELHLHGRSPDTARLAFNVGHLF